jgi:hypothetical protein
MLTRLFRRLLGRGADGPPPAEQPAQVGDDKAGANAVEHLGGFDPNELIEER